MLIITIFIKDFIKINFIKYVLSIIRPSVIGMIMAVGLYMIYENFGLDIIAVKKINYNLLVKSIIVFLIIIIVNILYKKLIKKPINSIFIIVLGAILGIAINLIM